MPPSPGVKFYDNLDRLNFVYPHYESPFLVSINQNYSQWMDRYCYQWAIDNSGFMKRHESYVDSIRKSDLGQFSACCFPSANWHRLEKLTKWCTMFFIIDDYHDSISKTNSEEIKCDNFWHQMVEMLEDIVEPKKFYNQQWPQFIKAVQMLLKEIYFDYTDEQIKRSINMIQDYIFGNLLETEWSNRSHSINNNDTVEKESNATQIKTGDKIPDWNTYMKARLGSVGGQMTLQLVEYAKNIALSDDEWNHHLMKDLIKAVSDEMTLVNDHLTFRKEIAENDFKFSKMQHVYSLLVNQGFTLQEAVDKVHKLIQEKDLLISSLINQILAEPQLNSSFKATERLRIYLDGVQEVVGGYWRFAITARRYHGLNFKNGALPPGGHFVYDPNETIILGNKNHRYNWLRPIPENIQPQ